MHRNRSRYLVAFGGRAATCFAAAFLAAVVFAAVFLVVAFGAGRAVGEEGAADESGTTVSTVPPDGTLYGEGQA